MQPVIEALATLGVILGLITAVFALDRTPIGKVRRWMTRQLITEPFTGWFRREVREVVNAVIEERLLAPNGGRSLHDIACKVDAVQGTTGRIERAVAAQDERGNQ